MASNISRSVYVEQLRRAFLLRAHPDRFRNHGHKIRRGQASLLQALSERMNSPDFQYYTSNQASMASSYQQEATSSPVISYVLERRDGTLLTQQLNLNASVEKVLQSMVDALLQSGASSLPPPPPSPAPTVNPFPNAPWEMSWTPPDDAKENQHINHIFDVNTTKGRNLVDFLKSVSNTHIEQCRSHRMDVSAAAMVARRLYHFQAIDGVQIDWSSSSYAVLLRSLIDLHEEHHTNFKVDAFYPLRLVFSNDEFRTALDVFGGTLRLRPNATQIQWLQALQEVTQERLELFRENRRLLDERTTLLQQILGAKIRKGLSCNSKDYHLFLEQLTHQIEPTLLLDDNNATITTTPALASNDLAMEQVQVVVESPWACRRPIVTKEGTVRVHCEMTLTGLIRTTQKLSDAAREQRNEEQDYRQRCKKAVKEAQWALGVNKVFRKGIVSHTQFLTALSRLMEQQSTLTQQLSGKSVGIAGDGHFCHVGDDGSLILPHNWS